MTSAQIQQLYQQYHVPSHIQRHMTKVAEFAVFLGEKINEHAKNSRVNLTIVEQAALLHDLVKVCDIPLERLLLNGNTASSEDIACWKNLYEKYHTIGHAKAGGEILHALNEPALANIIAKHAYISIIDPDPAKRPQNWEEKLVYYTDKRVKHDQLVSLQERLQDGRERYFPDGNLPDHEAEVEKALLALEQEIYNATAIKNVDL